jgi:hypothetical protein
MKGLYYVAAVVSSWQRRQDWNYSCLYVAHLVVGIVRVEYRSVAVVDVAASTIVVVVVAAMDASIPLVSSYQNFP